MFSYGCDLIQLTRRQWLTATGLAISSACTPKPRTGYRGYALIADTGDHSIAVVDLTAFRLIKQIALRAAASDIIACGQGRSLALTPTTGSVHMIDAHLRLANSRRLSENVLAICVAPNGAEVVAIAPEARELIVADAISLQVRARYKLSAEPIALTLPPAPQSGESAKPRYVATSTGTHGTVELFDYGTGQRWRSDLPGAIGNLRFRADGERLLVANLQERCLTVLSTPTLQRIADLPLSMKPEQLCFNADQGQLFVSGKGMDAVAIVFPYNPLEVDQTVLAGRDPGVMACSEDPAFLFVGSNSGSDVCIVNIDSRKVIGIVDAGQRPTYIAVTPDSQYALVLNQGAGTMAVIHIPAVLANASDPAKWRNKATAGLFTMLQVGDSPVQAAIVPKAA